MAPATAAPRRPPAARGLDTKLGNSGLPGATVLHRLGPRLGLHTVRELLFHLPRRYDDLREISTAAQLARMDDGTMVTTRVQVVSLRVQQTFRRRVQRTLAVLRDQTGDVEATWFGRRFIERRLKEGDTVILSGRLKRLGWRVSLDNPEFQLDDGSVLLHAGRIVPLYRLTEGLTARTLRTAMRAALDRYGPYPDYLPPSLRGDRAEIGAAIEAAHYPQTFPERDRALDRLAFDELLALQVGMVSRQRQRGRLPGEVIPVSTARLAEAVGKVEVAIDATIRRRDPDSPPVHLTADQRSAVDEIRRDLGQRRPMLRLLQGDVGSGKTAVAAMAMAFVADAGRQSALLAPTDLLARQHAATLRALLEPLGHGVTLLTASLPVAVRREALESIEAPVDRTSAGLSAGRVIVGTHALVQEAVRFANLRLAVVDEQHRFGVAERDALTAKGTAPHVLLMTATPIPRTLGQILHADLDVSDLHAAPQGRITIRTTIRQPDELVRHVDRKGDRSGDAPAARPGVIPFIVGEAARGHRSFVVVPLVQEDEAATATSVEAAARMLRERWDEAAGLAGVPGTPAAIEIVHGQLKASVRDERMERFRSGETTVLVGTTVLEVGVDVPEATVMLILDADRFGVAQLHQLRGRVGRGEQQAYCILVSSLYPGHRTAESTWTDEQRLVRARLDAVAGHSDGFVLADLDFELRREGELLGLQQSGLPPFRVASMAVGRHRALSGEARTLAEQIVDADGRLQPDLEGLEMELTGGWLARVGAGDVLAPAEVDA
jgi:ATP-dependent DNA helicase RecG